MEPAPDLSNRRPLKSRSTRWAQSLSRSLSRLGLTADAISIVGVIAALAGALALYEASRWPWLYLAAVAGVQLRLLCNLLDGLVAIEGGKKSPVGPLYNEVPDRIEDSILLIAAGFASGWLALGLAAALAAALTAYIRALGGSLGFNQDFAGPMAKQHRMATLTVGILAAFIVEFIPGFSLKDGRLILALCLLLIIAGALVTMVRRIARIARQLRGAA